MSTNQSIKRAFSILNTIANHPDNPGVTKIANQTGLHKSTVSRMLVTLEEEGAVERLSNGEGFRLGRTIALMAANIAYPRHLITLARPFLQELAEATGETINLCIPDGDLAHYIDQLDSQYNLQIRDWTGYRIPVHASVDGKLFLAHWPEDKIEEYLGRPLQRFSENTLTNPDHLRQNLAQIRRQSYAWTNGEYEVGIAGVSVPIWGQNQQIIASICVGGPTFRFPPEAEAGPIITHMQTISHQIAERL